VGDRPGDVERQVQFGRMLMTTQAVIELATGAPAPTPLEWPFSNETNEQEALGIRLSYIRGLREILVLALYAPCLLMTSKRC